MSLSVHIRKKFGSFHLAVDLEHSGGVAGILGASGCGKSMTLKCIAGIVKPDEGRIVLDNRVLFDSEKRINLKPQQRGVGYLFQNYALFPNMTLERNILCGLVREKNAKLKRQKLEEMLAVMELEGQRSLYPHQLSGGQQQRTALARMLVNNPNLLLLDEPFSALDSYLREQLQTQVVRILQGYGKDVLMVSHSREEVYSICNKVSVMNKGQVLIQGDTRAIFADPQSEVAAVLTGCKNIAKAVKSGEHEVYVPDWDVHLATERTVRDDVCAVGLRAHHFSAETDENLLPIKFAALRDAPFELQVMFRYVNQKTGTADIWWKMPKDKWTNSIPECFLQPRNAESCRNILQVVASAFCRKLQTARACQILLADSMITGGF